MTATHALDEPTADAEQPTRDQIASDIAEALNYLPMMVGGQVLTVTATAVGEHGQILAHLTRRNRDGAAPVETTVLLQVSIPPADTREADE